MRISDWSSDVCSSDLLPIVSDRLMARISFVDRQRDGYLENSANPGESGNDEDGRSARLHVLAKPTDTLELLFSADKSWDHTCDNMLRVVGGALYDGDPDPDRTEERPVGKKCVSTGKVSGCP